MPSEENPVKFLVTLAFLFYSLTMTILFSLEAFSHKRDQADWRKQCIARGVAEYDKVTGEWKWTKEIAPERKECE